MFTEIADLLRLLAPLIAIQLALQIYCLLDLWKFNKNKRDRQDRLVWTLVIVFFSLFGSLAYLVFERR